MKKSELIEFLKENLELDVERHLNYTGGIDGGPLYEKSYVIKLKICNEVISEEHID